MSATEEIKEQIRIHGSKRDALNIALARVALLNAQILNDTPDDGRCPVCGAEISQGDIICDGCYHDAQVTRGQAPPPPIYEEE